MPALRPQRAIDAGNVRLISSLFGFKLKQDVRKQLLILCGLPVTMEYSTASFMPLGVCEG